MDIFEAEERAVTESPDAVGINMDPIQPAVFAPSIAGMMGIDMPRVMSGTFAQSRITTSLTAAMKAKGADAEATAATFATASTTPRRISARLEFVAEDVASAGVGNFEASLRQNLSMALSAALDNAIINGDRTNARPNDVNGLVKALGAVAAQGARLNFEKGIEVVAGLVDGLWAFSKKDIRQIVGVDTYQRMASVLSPVAGGGNTGVVTLADYLMQAAGGVMTNARMPAIAAGGAAAKNQVALAFRSGRSGMRTAVCPHWGRLSIEDIYTGAARAETAVTFHVLLGDVLVIQPGAYQKLAYQPVA